MAESQTLKRMLETEERIEALEAIVAAFVFGDGIDAASIGEDTCTSAALMFIEYDLAHAEPPLTERRRRALERAVTLLAESLPSENVTRGIGPPPDDG